MPKQHLSNIVRQLHSVPFGLPIKPDHCAHVDVKADSCLSHRDHTANTLVIAYAIPVSASVSIQGYKLGLTPLSMEKFAHLVGYPVYHTPIVLAW